MRLDFKGFELKSLDDSQGEGVFSGYASTWDKDLYDDVIVKGAFADTLRNDFQGSGAGIPIHWQLSRMRGGDSDNSMSIRGILLRQPAMPKL